MPERLSPEDARILALEAGPIVGHTCKILIAERSGDTVERLRRQIDDRIALALRCRQKLATNPFHLGTPTWVDDPDFDVRRQVRRVAAKGPVDRARLREIVGGLMAERLPRDRPLWAIDVVEGLEDDRFAAVWRIHHAMADGQATMGIGSALVWSESPEPEPAPAPPPVVPAPPAPARLAATLGDHAQAIGAATARVGAGLLDRRRWRQSLDEIKRAPATIARELAPSRARSPFDAAIGRERRVAFVDHDFDAVHGAAQAHGEGVTVNDVVLAAVGGGLRRWLEARHGDLSRVRVQVPVSMHRSDEEPGAIPNRDSFINVDLPVEEEDARRLLLRVSELTRERKSAHDADELYALFADVAHVSGSLYRLAHRLASNPHVFALSVSNVCGPSGTHYLAGGRIHEFYSLAEVAPHHALRVSADSFAGRMSIGLCADAVAVPDLDLLAEGVERSLAELASPL
jgi:diacylglycerol O-acyltransferase